MCKFNDLRRVSAGRGAIANHLPDHKSQPVDVPGFSGLYTGFDMLLMQLFIQDHVLFFRQVLEQANQEIRGLGKNLHMNASHFID